MLGKPAQDMVDINATYLKPHGDEPEKSLYQLFQPTR